MGVGGEFESFLWTKTYVGFNPQLDSDENVISAGTLPPLFFASLLLLLLPLVASWMIWSNYQPKGVKAEVAVVQTNFDLTTAS